MEKTPSNFVLSTTLSFHFDEFLTAQNQHIANLKPNQKRTERKTFLEEFISGECESNNILAILNAKIMKKIFLTLKMPSNSLFSSSMFQGSLFYMFYILHFSNFSVLIRHVNSQHFGQMINKLRCGISGIYATLE